jgi:hypothetical protein
MRDNCYRLPEVALACPIGYRPGTAEGERRRMSDPAEPTVIARREGAAGTILMNRPKR